MMYFIQFYKSVEICTITFQPDTYKMIDVGLSTYHMIDYCKTKIF